MVAVARRKDIDTEFGNRLRFHRERLGLSPTDLGSRAGMAATTIARIERGEREPTWGVIKKIADALGVDLNAFRDPKPAEDAEARSVGKRK